ncbi:hypothetical protein F4780DRAFT_779549 [Xylariomycetidae sp. FL0641]|nr:hypothetical protein F4780DRAFT_779549 [Xylariomycetidae sp. FL0641]
MVRTRKGATTGTSPEATREPHQATAPSQENQEAITTNTGGAKPARGQKRKSTVNPAGKATQSSKKAKQSKHAEPESSGEDTAPSKPRLTTPDLEFDYDHSQLRDPRPTPGRKRRPRLDGMEVTEEFKARFYVPKPEKPKGRLNAFQKNEIFRQECFLDPSEHFHALYICHKKGRHGSPTYDSAGFQLDWAKVDDWMKPKAYSKSRIVGGMEKRLEKGRQERRDMFSIFFVDDGKGPSQHDIDFDPNLDHYVKDHVSKDLGVPWHQIGPKELKTWEEKGFSKQEFEKWWKKPNDEERKRMLKMLSGASLRKNL